MVEDGGAAGEVGSIICLRANAQGVLSPFFLSFSLTSSPSSSFFFSPSFPLSGYWSAWMEEVCTHAGLSRSFARARPATDGRCFARLAGHGHVGWPSPVPPPRLLLPLPFLSPSCAVAWGEKEGRRGPDEYVNIRDKRRLCLRPAYPAVDPCFLLLSQPFSSLLSLSPS